MNALKLQSDITAPAYVGTPIDVPVVSTLDVLEPAAPAHQERRSARRRNALRLTRASDDEFHLFRIY